MRMMNNFSILLVVAMAGVSAAFAADGPMPAVTAHRQAASPVDDQPCRMA